MRWGLLMWGMITPHWINIEGFQFSQAFSFQTYWNVLIGFYLRNLMIWQLIKNILHLVRHRHRHPTCQYHTTWPSRRVKCWWLVVYDEIKMLTSFTWNFINDTEVSIERTKRGKKSIFHRRVLQINKYFIIHYSILFQFNWRPLSSVFLLPRLHQHR